jgi:hypothetical protein
LLRINLNSYRENALNEAYHRSHNAEGDIGCASIDQTGVTSKAVNSGSSTCSWDIIDNCIALVVLMLLISQQKRSRNSRGSSLNFLEKYATYMGLHATLNNKAAGLWT